MSQGVNQAGAQANAGALVPHPIRLIAKRGDEKLTEQVFQHTPIKIGRLLDNDFVLPFDLVSRFHCELRYEGGNWTAVDLRSKNGLTIAGKVSPEISLQNGTAFWIQEISIQFIYEIKPEITDAFRAIREADTVIGSGISPRIPPSTFSQPPPPPSPQTMAKPTRTAQVPESYQASINRTPYEPAPAEPGSEALLDVDVDTLLLQPHTRLDQYRHHAVQLIVLWYDQVIESSEVPFGERIIWRHLGAEIILGFAQKGKTSVRVPSGCQPIGEARRTLIMTPDQPAAFRKGELITVSLRYVPKSPAIARRKGFVNDRLVNPLLLSSTVHGTLALSALLTTSKITPIREEPERFATILVAPTPQAIVAQPTPMPTPPPPPVPSPTPEMAKVEPPKPKEIDPPKPAKVVVEKKLRKIAIAKKQDVTPVHHEAKPSEKPQPKIAEAAKTPPPKLIAKVEPPPPAPAPPAPPAATPQPFNAKSVGALKMLSMLKTGPASNMANVDKIQVSRAPASVTDDLVGREPVAGTGDMISKLAKSTDGEGQGKGNTAGVAVGGKSAGAYQTAGLSGDAGNRKIRGSVTGGATYTETSKSEGLTSDQVMKVVRKNENKIQQCYERSLLDNPDLSGSAEFKWEIAPAGTVNFVNVKTATIKGGESLLDCVKGVFSAMTFPKSKNGESTTSTISLPFGRL